MNRLVVAHSVARFGDPPGNSILFVVFPLFVARLPALRYPLPEPVRVGILLHVFLAGSKILIGHEIPESPSSDTGGGR
jgi:hypothetical protein